MRACGADETDPVVRKHLSEVEAAFGLARDHAPVVVFDNECRSEDGKKIDRVRRVSWGPRTVPTGVEQKLEVEALYADRPKMMLYETRFGLTLGLAPAGLLLDFDAELISVDSEGACEAVRERMYRFDLMLVAQVQKRESWAPTLEEYLREYLRRWGQQPFEEFFRRKALGAKAYRIRRLVGGCSHRLEVVEKVLFPLRRRVRVGWLPGPVKVRPEKDALLAHLVREARHHEGQVLIPADVATLDLALMEMTADYDGGVNTDHWPLQDEEAGRLSVVPSPVPSPRRSWSWSVWTRTPEPEHPDAVGMGMQFRPRYEAGPSPWRGVVEGRRKVGSDPTLTGKNRLVALALWGVGPKAKLDWSCPGEVGPTLAHLLDHQWFDVECLLVHQSDVGGTVVGVGQKNAGSKLEPERTLRTDYLPVVIDYVVTATVGKQDGGVFSFGGSTPLFADKHRGRRVKRPERRDQKAMDAYEKRWWGYTEARVAHVEETRAFPGTVLGMFSDQAPPEAPVAPEVPVPERDPVQETFRQMAALHAWHNIGRAPTEEDARRVWGGESPALHDCFRATAGIASLFGQFGQLSARKLPELTLDEQRIVLEVGEAVIRALNPVCPGTDLPAELRPRRREEVPLLVGPLEGIGEGVADRFGFRVTLNADGLRLWVNSSQWFQVDVAYAEALVAAAQDRRSAPHGHPPLLKLLKERTPDLRWLDTTLREIRGYDATEAERNVFRLRRTLDPDVQMQVRVALTGWLLYFTAVRAGCRRLGIDIDDVVLGSTYRL